MGYLSVLVLAAVGELVSWTLQHLLQRLRMENRGVEELFGTKSMEEEEPPYN